MWKMTKSYHCCSVLRSSTGDMGLGHVYKRCVKGREGWMGWVSSFKVKIVFVLKEVWPEIKSFHDNHLSCIKSSNAISKYAPNASHYFRKKSDYMNYFIHLVWIQHKNYLYDFRNFWAMKKILWIKPVRDRALI